MVCGAGVCGLTAAMLLANDGHEVVVLERDPAPPPDPNRAWEDWERRGVNQFRLPHFLLPAFRDLMEVELPEVLGGLVAAGAHSFNLLGPMAGALDPDGRHHVVTARRPMVEAVVAEAADRTAGVNVRRGVAVREVVTKGNGGIPRVVGVRTDEGEEVPADLVIDAGGRRSPMARWLSDAGGRPPTVEEEDSGFVYYGRHVRASEGVNLGGPGMALAGSLALLVLPADHEISGIGIIAGSDDAEMRALRREAPWTAAMDLLPGGPAILDSEFVSPLTSMAAIEDRWRRYVVDGVPVATGVVAVGDAWAATNPTLGRGVSLAVRHARALRDTIRDVGLEPDRLVRRFDEVTEEEFTPWYRSTVWHDRHRLADMESARRGETPTPDPDWSNYLRFMAGAIKDPSLLLGRMLEWLHLEERPEQTLADPIVLHRLDELAPTLPPPGGPTRARVVEAVSAAS